MPRLRHALLPLMYTFHYLLETTEWVIFIFCKCRPAGTAEKIGGRAGAGPAAENFLVLELYLQGALQAS